MNAHLAAERFLESPSLSAATKRAYRTDVAEFLRWLGERDLESVDVRVLVEYVGWLGTARGGRGKLAPTSVARKLTAVRAFLRHSLG
ncbi:MAG: site-specific integrase, partial [Actinomycetota bacterium]